MNHLLVGIFYINYFTEIKKRIVKVTSKRKICERVNKFRGEYMNDHDIKKCETRSYHSINDGEIINIKAMISLVLGCVSIILTFFSLLGLIIAVAGFIVSCISLKAIYMTGQKGYIFALVGLILNTLSIVIPLVIFIISLLFFTPTQFQLEMN